MLQYFLMCRFCVAEALPRCIHPWIKEDITLSWDEITASKVSMSSLH